MFKLWQRLSFWEKFSILLFIAGPLYMMTVSFIVLWRHG